MKYSVNGVSELDRSKFFIVHHSIDDSDWDSDEQRQSFLEDNDVYAGRSTGGITWHFRQTAEDPDRAGWPSIGNMQTRGAATRNDYAVKSSAHAFEDRVGPMVIAGQPSRMYPNGQETPAGLVYESHEAVAEFYANFFSEFYGTGGNTGPVRPTYLEVFNEPFVKANDIGTTVTSISQLHNVVADRVRQTHPDMWIGGYGAAHPAYESNNFSHWNNRWKLFIDVAGDKMDFFSYHLYDNHSSRSAPQVRRKGSNIEAIMDMVEHYSMLRLGTRKPVYITEFGYFLQEAVAYNKQSDWYQLRSYNSMLMQFLERQDVIFGTIPFMILKAEWGRNEDGIPYGPRIMRQKKEVEGFEGNGDDWVYTDLVKYWEFWKDLKGVRAESRSDNFDILTDAYVDGNKAYVLLSNLSFEDQEVNLNVSENTGRNLASITVSHLHANDQIEAVWDQFELEGSSVQIGAEATMLLIYEYDDAITQNEESAETKYFADNYLRPINANDPISVNINGVATTEIGEAMLRLGLGRDHGLSLKPVVSVNGVRIAVPSNWRGDAQPDRSRFFGVLEVPVPNQLLETDNTIEITFSDGGGHVSSISMQYFAQTVEPNKPEPPLSTTNLVAHKLELYPNPAQSTVRLTLPKGVKEALVRVVDMRGVNVLEKRVTENNSFLNVKNLTGLYVVQLVTEKELIESKLLIE
ncbi:MAG: T9SS type A sorting domain-containing protein [Bacteroidota bacterium]